MQGVVVLVAVVVCAAIAQANGQVATPSVHMLRPAYADKQALVPSSGVIATENGVYGYESAMGGGKCAGSVFPSSNPVGGVASVGGMSGLGILGVFSGSGEFAYFYCASGFGLGCRLDVAKAFTVDVPGFEATGVVSVDAFPSLPACNYFSGSKHIVAASCTTSGVCTGNVTDVTVAGSITGLAPVAAPSAMVSNSFLVITDAGVAVATIGSSCSDVDVGPVFAAGGVGSGVEGAMAAGGMVLGGSNGPAFELVTLAAPHNVTVLAPSPYGKAHALAPAGNCANSASVVPCAVVFFTEGSGGPDGVYFLSFNGAFGPGTIFSPVDPAVKISAAAAVADSMSDCTSFGATSASDGFVLVVVCIPMSP